MTKVLRMRVPDALHDTIKELAQAEGQNVSETCRILLAAGLNQVTDRHLVRAQLDDQIETLTSKIGDLEKFRRDLDANAT